MFTGLIQHIGTVTKIVTSDIHDTQFWIESDLDLSAQEIGASIACSGACMTVIEKTDRAFCISVSKESLDKTTLKFWRAGSKVNIEPSLRVGDPLGGHFVTGHVDGLAKIIGIVSDKNSHIIRLEPGAELIGFIAKKGSVALDGVSLTVNDADRTTFTINIIPHTWEHTTFHERKIGDTMNIEIDLIARYLLRQQEMKAVL